MRGHKETQRERKQGITNGTKPAAPMGGTIASQQGRRKHYDT